MNFFDRRFKEKQSQPRKDVKSRLYVEEEAKASEKPIPGSSEDIYSKSPKDSGGGYFESGPDCFTVYGNPTSYCDPAFNSRIPNEDELNVDVDNRFKLEF